MVFPECKLFRDVALQRNVSRAAAANGISQSAATQQIQELERRLGTELLDRRTRPIGLTAAGKLYLEFCRDVVRRADEFQAALDGVRESACGELHIASIYSVALTEMTRVRGEFGSLCPGIDLKVEYLQPEKVYEAVLNECADLGLVSYPEASREMAVIPWRQEAMAVALPPGHRLSKRVKLRPRDLDAEDFVAFDPHLAIRKDVDRFLREQNAAVRVVMNFDNIPMIKEAVALGSRHQHPAGPHHAERSRTGTPASDPAGISRIDAAGGRGLPQTEEIHARCQSVSQDSTSRSRHVNALTGTSEH